MGKLIYTVLASLDGYVADVDGSFDWAAPGEDVHQFVNELERLIGTRWPPFLGNSDVVQLVDLTRAVTGIMPHP